MVLLRNMVQSDIEDYVGWFTEYERRKNSRVVNNKKYDAITYLLTIE